MKSRRILRPSEARGLLRRAGAQKGPAAAQRAEALRVLAQFAEQLGSYNEKLGFHKGRYPLEDGEALRWMLLEADKTGETRGETLAKRWLEKHPDHPGQSYDANVKRLKRLWLRTPKRTKNSK